MSQNEQTPLSIDELMNRCMGELDFATTVLHSFLDGCDEQLDTLERHYRNGATDEVAKMAHRIKGTAATVAAGPLRNTMESIESVAGDCETEKLPDLINGARVQVKQLKTYANENFACP